MPISLHYASFEQDKNFACTWHGFFASPQNIMQSDLHSKGLENYCSVYMYIYIQMRLFAWHDWELNIFFFSIERLWGIWYLLAELTFRITPSVTHLLPELLTFGVTYSVTHLLSVSFRVTHSVSTCHLLVDLLLELLTQSLTLNDWCDNEY